MTLSDTSGVRLFLSVPSLDTGVCDAEVRRFNQEATSLGNVKVYAVSMDLPFAQKRWCGAAGVENVDHAFGPPRCVVWHQLGRAHQGAAAAGPGVFVVDSSNTVTYVEYLPRGDSHPDYEKALAAVKEAK